MGYSTGSPLADAKLETTIESVKRGSSHAHGSMGYVFCGEFCLTPVRADIPESVRHNLAKRVEEIKSLGVAPDYTKAYAHFILADNMKTGYRSMRKRLAEEMSAEELKTAKQLASAWEWQEKKERKEYRRQEKQWERAKKNSTPVPPMPTASSE